MRIPPATFCLLLTALSACASPAPRELAGISRTHLDQLDQLLTSARGQLLSARRDLSSAAPPANPPAAAHDLDGGARSLATAHDLVPLLRQDVQSLSDAAVNLQNQIDAHQNDLLGPRAKRIRNRLILLALLASIGAALLRVGPLFGGPLGGAAVLTGHLLTAFAVPLITTTFSILRRILSWTIGKLLSIAKLIPSSLGRLAAPKPIAASTPTTL
jgi:hypothetical protein